MIIKLLRLGRHTTGQGQTNPWIMAVPDYPYAYHGRARQLLWDGVAEIEDANAP